MDSRKKILVVDDEQINLDFFDVMLSKLGFIVEKAQDGVAAVEKAKRFNPDIIMLDNIMPKMSGWEVTKILKGDPEFKEIPIIMLSALDDVKDKVEGFELGVDDYITKPFNFSEVLARIRAVLRNRELLGQIVVRESRLHIAERFAAHVKESMENFITSIDELEAHVALASQNQAPIDEHTWPRLAAAIGEKTARMRKRAAELDQWIAQAASEWGALKKNEIGLQALKNHIHKLAGAE
ncbi:MAG: response regulator [Treponema sp.]|jgi:DNA-binding response OmpR family regulator|nr:response regulator [Treponema sp.]